MAQDAALCYRTIGVDGAEFFGPDGHPEVSMDTHSLPDHLAALELEISMQWGD